MRVPHVVEGLQSPSSAKVKAAATRVIHLAVVMHSSLTAGMEEGGLMNYLDRLQMPHRP